MIIKVLLRKGWQGLHRRVGRGKGEHWEILLKEYDLYCRKAGEADPEWRNIEGVREHVARKLAPRFGVNCQVLETRFDRENIWPAS